MNIPVLNIYHMLLYAWDALEQADSVQVQDQEYAKLVDLFAGVLHTGTEHILRRGLDRGYIPVRETIAGIRGKVDLSASVKTNVLQHAKAVCEYDELSHDVPHNRILKSTIRRLLKVDDLSDDLREQLAETHYRLHQIAEIEVTDRAFRSIRLHRNNRQYGLLMDVCRLIHDARLTTEEAGEKEFRDFFRDVHKMRHLFERFVRNFYRNERKQGRLEFRVGRKRLDWVATATKEADGALIPKMFMDIPLVSPKRVIIIETKFVPEALTEHLQKFTLRSGHLYQLFAYLKNYEPLLKPGQKLEGILLYPTVSVKLDLRYTFGKHPVRVVTVDLNRPWMDVEEHLRLLVSQFGTLD